MDPYLERAELWPDFHDRLITYLAEALQPLLRPRYVAVTQERLFVVESDRPIRPDVSIVPTGAPQRSTAGSQAADAALVLDLVREEVRQLTLHIIEPAAQERVVTAIEVLSHDNKTAGTGRDAYLRKREELWGGGANLVEVDLLRAGLPTVRVDASRLALPSWHYLIAVTRVAPTRYELYTSRLEARLPRIAVPLAPGDPDVVLDLQHSFSRCWEAGPYPELLRYQNPPPGKWSAEEIAFCRARIDHQA